MRKILIILITIPLIFSSCEKEEEDNNNNNNSSLSLEQTKWNVDYITGIGVGGTMNIPTQNGFDGGLDKVEWTFFDNNGLFVEEYVVPINNTNFNNTHYYDTLIYSYFSNLNTISYTDPSSDNTVAFFCHDTFSIGNGLKIILFNQNNLTVEYTDPEYGLFTVYLSRIQ